MNGLRFGRGRFDTHRFGVAPDDVVPVVVTTRTVFAKITPSGVSAAFGRIASSGVKGSVTPRGVSPVRTTVGPY